MGAIKAHVEDALHSTRAATEEGVVHGGGVALIRCIERLSNLKFENDDQQAGIRIVIQEIQAALRTIATNAGAEASVVDKVLCSKGANGYNAATGKYEDLVKAGIIDPTKVKKTALQNAGSIAGLMLIT